MMTFKYCEDFDNENLFLNWIGQAGFNIKIPNGPLICLDPYYSNSIERYEGRECRRLWYNDFKIEFFKPDIVLCSHDHLDHTDPETLPLIYAYSDAIFYGPEASVSHMKSMKFNDERLRTLYPDKKEKLSGFNLIPKQSFHMGDSLGFMFEINGFKIYFTGDTAFDRSLDFLNTEEVDILLSCVNGKYNNMTIEDSVSLYECSGAKTIIPMHYGVVANNTVSVEAIKMVYDDAGINYFIPKVEKWYEVLV